MSASCRPGLVASLLILLASHAGAVELPSDYRGKATDLAFAALLSMPGAAPAEGEWIIPRPADFAPGDEARLIVWLNRQLDNGAQLEARRHFGTLLQHALRARLGRTALWLLTKGANPRPADGADALMLARRYELTEVAQQLIGRHGFRDPPSLLALYRGVTLRSCHLKCQRLSRERKLGELRDDWERQSTSIQPERLVELVAISANDPVELEEVLSLVPAEAGPARTGALLDGMLWAAEDDAVLAPPIESWRLLWEHVGLPMDYASNARVGDGRLLGLFPAAHLDELLDSGYAALGAPRALGCQLVQWDAAQLEAHWPVLKAHLPDLPRLAVALVLDPYRLGSDCWIRDREQLAAALTPSVIERLRDWLPLEDWGPVLRVIEAEPRSWNQPLVPLDAEPDRQLSRLDCALQHAQQQLCGGGWRMAD